MLALAIAGLGAQDIMGFCVIHLLYAGVIIIMFYNYNQSKKLVLY
ncbi:hypothetical protein D0U04_24265 [Bacillus clarus]|uniref:Uncharacterized protein n=1 Tax=Bacillus clarus TaxID=2338372 RepID=A0ABX9KPW7_9BACI|nr:hypothetical protein D0U04_24265 [Bacillus clarus]